MELPVVIFVSAVTGAISSIVVQVLFRKSSNHTSSTIGETTKKLESVEQEKSKSPIHAESSPKPEEQKVEAEPVDTKENKGASDKEKDSDEQEPEPSSESKTQTKATEENDEANLVTGSDLTQHIPKLSKFRDLNIPSIDNDKIQVPKEKSTKEDFISENEESPPQSPIESETSEEPGTDSFNVSEVFSVPEHNEVDDDDATVLVKRTPPK